MQTFNEVFKKSGLGKWFKEKWVDISRKDKSGKHPPCGASAGKEGRDDSQKKAYPKCRPAAKAGKMSAKLKKKAVAQKRRAEKKEPHSAGRKPVVVSHKNLEENMNLHEKNVPLDKALWSRMQAWARNTFDVHPSAYSNAAAAKKYKKLGGKWKSVKENVLPTFAEWVHLREEAKTSKPQFTFEDVETYAKKANLEKDIKKYSKKELVDGMNTEAEHMSSKKLDVIKGSYEKILKIALAHLEEDPKYYHKLKKAKL
jgi:hypothetical protein